MMQSSSPIVSVYFGANHRGKRRHTDSDPTTSADSGSSPGS